MYMPLYNTHGYQRVSKTPRNECQETKRQPNAMSRESPMNLTCHRCATRDRSRSTRSRAPVDPVRQASPHMCTCRDSPCPSRQSAAETGSRQPHSRRIPCTASGCAATRRKSTVSELAHEKHASQSTKHMRAQGGPSSMSSSLRSLMSSSYPS
jgi:hypothetical protein